MPTLTLPQFVFIEICKGILANNNVNAGPDELVRRATTYLEAVLAAMPQ